MTVRRHVERHAVERDCEVCAVIELEPAQLVLIGLALAAVLRDDEAGNGGLERLARPAERDGVDLLAGREEFARGALRGVELLLGLLNSRLILRRGCGRRGLGRRGRRRRRRRARCDRRARGGRSVGRSRSAHWGRRGGRRGADLRRPRGRSGGLRHPRLDRFRRGLRRMMHDWRLLLADRNVGERGLRRHGPRQAGDGQRQHRCS